MTSEIKKEAEQFMRDKIAMLLSQCTEKQQELFHKMYLDGVQGIPFDRLDWAATQIENTLIKNDDGVPR